ncbi:hypothetical protein EJ03DRAFT_331094 [Teratosphaeria nubilosa]|uniref:Uncharacterized protein n=1 Tax=Teratosphaeria nubilosa TaxID=161662 RepID=A0A6G1KYP0_9PEZI|nr:hypothetical protein EJ03DRAFT_331094 [Teratosphaeria nubilosa]
MPYSEFSMQNNVDNNLRRAKTTKLRGHFEVKRDIVLVMADDEASLPEVLTGMVFSLQTDPWRYEVDWWKRFVDVDLSFLECLDRKWLD